MTEHKNSRQIKILNQIYTLYEETMQHQKHVCKKGCASCCTCNVTLTGLEAEYLAQTLEPGAATKLKNAINLRFPENRFIPKTTTNQFARLCMEGRPVPEEENNPDWGKCPVLNDEICSIYDARPFGCRALMSKISCENHGYARIPPEIVTVNTIFMQAIEHLDQDGISGNFSDILPVFLDTDLPPEDLEKTIKDIRLKIKEKGSTRFTANEKIKVLMIEPEHRKKLSPIVQALSALLNTA